LARKAQKLFFTELEENFLGELELEEPISGTQTALQISSVIFSGLYCGWS